MESWAKYCHLPVGSKSIIHVFIRAKFQIITHAPWGDES